MITLLCLCTHSANIFTLSYVEFRFVARLWSAEWTCLARSTALRKIEQLVALILIMERAEWDQLTSGDVPPAATIGRSSRRSSASLFVIVSARMLKSLAPMVPPERSPDILHGLIDTSGDEPVNAGRRYTPQLSVTIHQSRVRSRLRYQALGFAGRSCRGVHTQMKECNSGS